MSENKSTNLDLTEDYNEFCKMSIAEGDSVASLPSLKEWEEIREHMSSEDNMLKFVNPNAGAALSTVASNIMSNPQLRRMVNEGVDSISKRGAATAAKIASDLASGTPFVKVKRDFGDTGGSSGNSAGGSGTAGKPFSPYRQNYNPKPVQVRLNTGIVPKTFGQYYPVSSEYQKILDISAVQFLVPIAAASQLKTYFDTVIAFNFQNNAQMRVSFNVNALNNFTATKLRNWMNAYSDAYAKYAFFTTIIGYCNEPLQQNEGIRALRSMITPQLLDDLSQLENMLDGTPAPPKFRELIHFVFGAPFKTSANPGASIRMISPTVLISGETPAGNTALVSFPVTVIQDAISALFAARETTALIARVCPTWIPGRGQTSGGMDVCEYSHNWHTIFENLPYSQYKNGIDYRGPAVSSTDNDVVYGATGDNLDGAVTAIASMYYPITGTFAGNWAPGITVPLMMGPINSNLSNRFSFIVDGTDRYFQLDSNLTYDHIYSRCETYTIAGTTHPLIWPGREKINNVNVTSSRETGYELFSMIFDLNDVPSNKGEKERFPKRRRGKKGKNADNATEE